MQDGDSKIDDSRFARCVGRVQGRVESTFVRMVEQYAWGEVPVGFRRFSPRPNLVVLARAGLERCLDPGKDLPEHGIGALAGRFHGRGKLALLNLGEGQTALVRSYRHGGVLRGFTRDLFFSWPPRPFKELAIILEVSRRGVPTVEALGAWVERVGGPFYRGWLITRELQGAQDVWDALRNGPYSDSERKLLLRAMARSVRRMHQRGVCHADLNLKNILVRRQGSEMVGYIIDLDKASLFPEAVPARRRQGNLRRLLRSVCKLDPQRRLFPPEAWDLFNRFYEEAAAT